MNTPEEKCEHNWVNCWRKEIGKHLWCSKCHEISSPSPEARGDWEETIFKIFDEWNSCFETRDDHDDMKRLIKRELQAAFEKGREAR